MSIRIASPSLLQIRNGRACIHGGRQTWYQSRWQRESGCGPTSCSHLLWYLSRTRPECSPLCPHDASTRDGFLRLMEEVWQFVTPTVMGLHSTRLFVKGAQRYGESHGIPLECAALDVSPIPHFRPHRDALRRFLASALERDLPVAFLNLSNGSLTNLHSWHWVTLIAFDPSSFAATMLDNGAEVSIDLGGWLQTTTLGGGFCVIAPSQL